MPPARPRTGAPPPRRQQQGLAQLHLLLVLQLFPVRLHAAGDELPGRVRDHPLLFGEILRREHVGRRRVLQQELAAREIGRVAAGIEWSRFALLAGALGVGIGFGLQEVVNNFISGLILIFERPIKIGDTIEYNSVRGHVIRIGIRSSTVRTFDGAEVIIPNGHLISNELTNWTLSDHQRRIEVLVGVAYGSNPNQVLEILLKVARENEKVLDNPEPVALFTGFGDNSLNFSLRFWTNDYQNWLILSSQITLEIHNALYAAGIEIPFPQRDLHIRSIDPDVSGVLKPAAQKGTRREKKKPE